MSERRVFLSYHFETDSSRADKIRRLNKQNTHIVFNEERWEDILKQSDVEIQEWIDKQLEQSDCLVVLIGEETAKKKWINYSIKRSYELDKGVVGIFVDRLLDEAGDPSERGEDPFHYVDLNSIKFSRFVERFESEHVTERYVYHDIRRNFTELIEYALENPPSTWDWDIYR